MCTASGQIVQYQITSHLSLVFLLSHILYKLIECLDDILFLEIFQQFCKNSVYTKRVCLCRSLRAKKKINDFWLDQVKWPHRGVNGKKEGWSVELCELSECMTQQGTEEFDHWHQMDSGKHLQHLGILFRLSRVTFSTSFITSLSRQTRRVEQSKKHREAQSFVETFG